MRSLARGQRAAEALMVDECVIRYATGTLAQDEVTGEVAPVLTERLTSSCKIQSRALVAADAEVGGRTATTVRVELHLPASIGAVLAGDLAEITSVGSHSDPQLIGRTFRILSPIGKTFQTARRFEVEEVVR